MKLLIIHNKYQSNNIGGEDIVYKNELESLQKRLGKENVFSYEVSNDDISKLKLVFGIWFSKKYYEEVKKIIEENGIDLVHIHNFYPLLTPSIFKASKDAGAKVVHTLHNYRLWCISGIFYRDGFGICELCTKTKFSLQGIFSKCFRKSMIQSILAQLSFWYYRTTKIFDNIDYFFVLTNFQKEKVKSLGIDENRIVLKPNSLNMTFDKNLDKKNYIYVGRLEESKGIYTLLEEWNTLDEEFILTIIGGGEIEEGLKSKYNKSNIIFKGKCSREETLKSISKAKYLIQPSVLYETFGLTIIEAMSFGVPVIGYNIGTRGDFIKDGINGFLTKEIDLKEVIEKSLYYEEYDSLSKNAIETAKLYENEYVIKKQIEIYKKIMENKI
ncbi:glycosyltransferase [Aliarcobacter butzleri]|uniref:glycosyltransferase n=1 Tax=Aliarcobacter butzleri TaxID=28197 RepID=UPI001EDAC5A7|nr:glycosyltransferase [Aliarcobacter butzleri]MCG3710609.1 glycosyltransferase [Aliarcobacter butzleri]MCG3714130.1 glycosyltransferase [Aliarcobacter butzleri]